MTKSQDIRKLAQAFLDAPRSSALLRAEQLVDVILSSPDMPSEGVDTIKSLLRDTPKETLQYLFYHMPEEDKAVWRIFLNGAPSSPAPAVDEREAFEAWCEDESALSILGSSFEAIAFDLFRGGIKAGRASLPAVKGSTEALQRFKDYVHQRLDEAGIPSHPDGEHSKHGCRIGDRLDIALARSAVRGSGVDVAVGELDEAWLKKVVSQEIYNSLSDSADSKDGWDSLSDEDFDDAAIRVVNYLKKKHLTPSKPEAPAEVRDVLAALKAAESALSSCYEVRYSPGDGSSEQDDALKVVKAAIEAMSLTGGAVVNVPETLKEIDRWIAVTGEPDCEEERFFLKGLERAKAIVAALSQQTPNKEA